MSNPSEVSYKCVYLFTYLLTCIGLYLYGNSNDSNTRYGRQTSSGITTVRQLSLSANLQGWSGGPVDNKVSKIKVEWVKLK